MNSLRAGNLKAAYKEYSNWFKESQGSEAGFVFLIRKNMKQIPLVPL
jgi:hypothetical protein